MISLRKLLSSVAALAMLAGCGSGDDDDGDGPKKPVEGTPIADVDAAMFRGGATYTSVGICTPVWVKRVAKIDNMEAYADHDQDVTFTLSQMDGVSAALYPDADCKTPASEVGSATPTAKYTLKAGATSVAAYVLASPVSEENPGKFDGGVSFGATYPEGYKQDDNTSALWFTREADRLDGLPVEILNMGKGTGLYPGTCTRFTAILVTADAIINTAKSDLAVTVGVSDTTFANAYSDSLCTAPVTSLSIKKGEQQVALFFKTTDPDPVTLTLTTPVGAKEYEISVSAAK